MKFHDVDDFVERYNEIRDALYGGPPSPDYEKILGQGGGGTARRGSSYEHPGMWAMSTLWRLERVLIQVHAETHDPRNFTTWCLSRILNLSWHRTSHHPQCPYSRSFLYAKGPAIIARVDQTLIDILSTNGLLLRD